MKFHYITIIVSFLSIFSCASYKYEITETKIPVSFSNDLENNDKFREFRIETKLSWYLFDTQPIDTFDLDEIIRTNLPNAKKICNLRIHSKENVADSMIRTLTTGIQFLFISNRALYSQRTVIIEGLVVE
ncbi:hypothetical protein EHQ24_08015 [Leptospira noumeaensis]|uniref:Lipoprotein n=1 Tax=Leptospira noumeaensis TaxID=2484964 RepID=A0A4V3JK35_9LEPT|nr:hypothetical protein [Leptospira noumeaensis]TGK83238.1 hypothetical protein EHQ24_08015 [Leptospira noumeaensis]